MREALEYLPSKEYRGKLMKAILVFKHGEVDRRGQSIAAVLLSILLLQTSIGFMANAQASQRAPKKSGKMSDDQRISQALSRLTFGARPGDFERVKAMGVDAFINQQLDPDSIDNTGVIAKLRRLPTIGMATPVIIEQYTPPKPVVSPSPVPAKSPDEKSPMQPKSIAENSLGQAPQLSANANMTAMQNEMQM